MKWVIDRIEGQWAVCQQKDGLAMRQVKINELPQTAKERDILEETPQGWEIKVDETLLARQQMKTRMEALFKRKGN